MISSELHNRIQAALRAEKVELKRQLREDIAHGRTARVFQYCTGASKKARQAMYDQLAFGTSVIDVTEADAEWALRYYRRLMGRPVA